VNTKGDKHRQDHGWCFEVPARIGEGLVHPTPLTGMGRFYHEAVAVDPRSGVVYLTEDRDDSLVYRFIPKVRGRLAEGGRLQALAIVDRPSIDTRNWSTAQGGTGVREASIGSRMHVVWLDIDVVDTPDDSVRSRGFAAGAAKFARGEGAWFGNDAIYIACTTGGPSQLGQVWRYVPSSAETTVDEARNRPSIELWVESDSGSILKNCDNLTVAPWGDVVVCEDGEGGDRVMGITPKGEVYAIASNVGTDSEVAGVCFSPSGRTLFFNLQQQAISVAVQGPWPGV
jgi:secreted PhoX family phosphatase